LTQPPTDVHVPSAHVHVPELQTTAETDSTAEAEHWCVLSDDVTPYPSHAKGSRGWFRHFPHAAEVLLPCWSWCAARGAEDRCHLLLLDGLTLREPGPSLRQKRRRGRRGAELHAPRVGAETWQSQLVERAMRCRRVVESPCRSADLRRWAERKRGGGNDNGEGAVPVAADADWEGCGCLAPEELEPAAGSNLNSSIDIDVGEAPPNPNDALVLEAYRHTLNAASNCTTNAAPEPEGGRVFHSPNYKWMRPRFKQRNYLRRPEDAQLLRRRLLGEDETEGEDGKEWERLRKPLRIGLIQREDVADRPNRVIRNLDAVAEGLREAFLKLSRNVTVNHSGSESDYPFPGGGRIEEQARWWAEHDVIVAAHGAALTNAVFVRPGTIVVQAYPPGFFWQTLDPLIEQAGGRALDWYEGGDPLQKFQDADFPKLRQFSDFDIPVGELVDLVLVALDLRPPTAKMLADENLW